MRHYWEVRLKTGLNKKQLIETGMKEIKVNSVQKKNVHGSVAQTREKALARIGATLLGIFFFLGMVNSFHLGMVYWLGKTPRKCKNVDCFDDGYTVVMWNVSLRRGHSDLGDRYFLGPLSYAVPSQWQIEKRGSVLEVEQKKEISMSTPTMRHYQINTWDGESLSFYDGVWSGGILTKCMFFGHFDRWPNEVLWMKP